MIVAKFGGASIQDVSSIDRVINNILDLYKKNRNLVLVFSAIGKTTRNLMNIFTSLRSRDEDYLSILKEVKEVHLEIAVVTSHPRINELFNELKDDIEFICKKNDFSKKKQDLILSYGELLSSEVLRGKLELSNIPVVLVDARELVKTNNDFTCAIPDEVRSCELINGCLLSLIKKEKVPITQGFISSNCSGETTTLGFEGSDYSAVLIGKALLAEEVRLYKTVDGIMTTDPSLVNGPRTISSLSYEEATELSRLGARCLHPRTFAPVISLNIPIKVLNSNNSSCIGTVIDHDGDRSVEVKSIVLTENKLSLIGAEVEHKFDVIKHLLLLNGVVFDQIEKNSCSVSFTLTNSIDFNEVYAEIEEQIL